MRVLSVQQPWAWLIVHGLKDIENRTWFTSYRGPLLIHASQRVDREWMDIIYSLLAKEGLPMPRDLPTGGIVGIVDLVDVVRHYESPWFEGPWGWVLENPRPIPHIPAQGRLGLWTPPSEIIELIQSLPL